MLTQVKKTFKVTKRSDFFNLGSVLNGYLFLKGQTLLDPKGRSITENTPGVEDVHTPGVKLAGESGFFPSQNPLPVLSYQPNHSISLFWHSPCQIAI